MPTRILRLALELALVGLTLGLLGTVLVARGVPMTGRLVFVVGGGSMEPALHVGSAVIVEPVPLASLTVGQIVTVEVGPEHAIFTHRITRLVTRPDGLWIETKGDADESPDPSIIPATSVVGRVQATIPGLGYVLAALSGPSGFGAALGLASLLVALILLLDGAGRTGSTALRPGTEPASILAEAQLSARAAPAHPRPLRPARKPTRRAAGGLTSQPPGRRSSRCPGPRSELPERRSGARMRHGSPFATPQ